MESIMSDEGTDNDPPQTAYQVVFALVIIALVVTVFRYPLW